MKIYVLFDKPRDLENMSFLTSAFEKEYEEIYPKWRCTSIKQILSVCWYDFMGVLCWWMVKLMNRGKSELLPLIYF